MDWVISTSEMMFGWFRIREMETAAVGISTGARGVVIVFFFGSLIIISGIGDAINDALSDTRRTRIEDAADDCDSVSLGI
jgi:hypothetical protein